MDTIAITRPPRSGLTPNKADRALGFVTLAFLALIAVAVLRGHAHWRSVPVTVWLHLAMLLPLLLLTPLLMTARKGDMRHRVLGYVWAGLLIGIAVEAFFIPIGARVASPIWLLCVFVLVQTPRLVLLARGHAVARHRRLARGLTVGALLVAGLFTLPFGRLLGTWLAGG